MAAHERDLEGMLLVGVGQAIDVMGGAKRAAPRWMTSVGMEWAFRLTHEPKRLARRYLRDDLRFFWWMLRERALAYRQRP